MSVRNKAASLPSRPLPEAIARFAREHTRVLITILVVLASISVIGTIGIITHHTDNHVAGGHGATLPYTEIEAENAATNGTIIGPDFTFTHLASEASGRKAVTLTRGQYVEFTLPSVANAIVVRYSIPDSADGTGLTAPLSIYINGVHNHAQTLMLTSTYGWFYGGYPFTNTPSNGLAHHFYDEAHLLLGEMTSTGTATIGSPVLARVNTTSPEWRRALALATEAGRADADASSCPRCGSAESFPALVSLHGQPTFVTRCAFCGSTRPFAPHPQENTMTDANERFDLPVTYGDGRVYIAHTVSGFRWNGYLCPAFTREVADQIAADLARDEALAPDEFRTLVRWNDELQVYLLQSAQYESAGDPPEIVRGHDSRGVTVYSIGGGSWTWSAAETSPASSVC